MDVSRGSLDSGYHSMTAKSSRGSQDALIQGTTFITPSMESSPERSPRKLHKAISSTFSGAMQAFSNTVRSTTSYIYPSAGEPELPSSEWAECETPKKPSRRSSIMSSIRRRNPRVTPQALEAKLEFPELPQSPLSMKQEKAPAIDVEIPSASISHALLEKGPTSTGSQLLAGVNLPAGSKNLWPGPTRLTVDQASKKDKRESLQSVFSKVDDPYVEEGDRFQDGFFITNSESEFDLESPSLKTKMHHMGDDKGYFSEVESNADISEFDELPPAGLKDVAQVSTEVKTSSPPFSDNVHAASHIHAASSASPCQGAISSRMSSSLSSGSGVSKAETSHGTAEQTASVQPPSPTPSHYCTSLEDGLNALFPSCDYAITPEPRSLYKRPSSDVYDADAESMDSSMGSRAAWERQRAERDRRYRKINMLRSTESNVGEGSTGATPSTESDEEAGKELELKRSPSKKPVHYAEELIKGTSKSRQPQSTRTYPNGDLCFAVEAIERQAFPVGDLAYAVEAIERPSVTTFDPLETVLQQRPMLRPSDTIDNREVSQVSDPWDIPLSCMETSSTPPADLSPSRVELPSSPESSPLDSPAVPKHTLMIKLADGELRTFEPGKFYDQSFRCLSSGFTDVSEKSSPGQHSHTAQGDAYDAGLKAGDLLVPAYLSYSPNQRSVGEDVYEVDLRAAGFDLPMSPSDAVQTRPSMDNTYEGNHKATSRIAPISKQTSRGIYREQLEAGSPLPKPRSRNGTPFEHNRTVSIFSDVTDDSCAITTHSPSCNVPPPFPSLHVRSEPARRSPSAIDALATHGDEQIRIAGPANAGIKSLIPSTFDGSEDQIDEAGSNIFSPKTLEGAKSPDTNAQMTWLELHDLQTPSPGTTSSVQSPISNAPQETVNAARLPSLVSPCIASRKARRKLKKSSSGIGTNTSADLASSPTNTVLQPDNSPSKRELSKRGARGKTQTPLSESKRLAQASNQKPSLDRQFSGKKGRVRDQTSLEGFTDSFGGSVRWLDPSSDSRTSKRSPSGKGRAAESLPVTPSPPRATALRARDNALLGKTRENVRSADKSSDSHFDPKLSIETLDSMSDKSPLYAIRRSGSSSHAGHELNSIFREDVSMSFSYDLDGDSQQNSAKNSDKTVVDLAGNDGTISKHVPHAPAQK